MTQPLLHLHAVNTRTSRLETKALPFEANGNFKFDVNITNTWRALAKDHHYAAALALSLTGSVDGVEVLTGEFMVEGLAEILGHDEASKSNILNIWIPNQLVPYVREQLASATAKSGFPTILLPPVVFQPPVIVPEQPALPDSAKQLPDAPRKLH